MMKISKFLFFLFILISFAFSVYAASRGSGGSMDQEDSSVDNVETNAEVRDNGMRARVEAKIMGRSPMLADKLKTARALEIKTKLNRIKLEASDTEGLRCFEQNELRDRIKCRLNIDTAQLRAEYKLEYLPEECRFIDNKTERQQCVRRYAQLQKCWKFIGDDRFRCVNQELNITEVKEEKRLCRNLNETERGDCNKRLKNKVYHKIKFRFYNLEEKAERFLKRGWVDQETVADFIANLEIKKAEFNEATTKEERKRIILEVRDLWKEFIKNVNRSVGEDGNETEG